MAAMNTQLPWKQRAITALLHAALHGLLLTAALGAFLAYGHYKLQAGSASTAHVFLGTSALLGFAPIRSIAHGIFAIEGKALHLLHGLGGLGLFALVGTGAVSGDRFSVDAALAPFSLMAAPQAFLHPHRASSPEEATAARRFIEGLPQLEALARPGALTSPEGMTQAMRALTTAVAKAEALGRAELKNDPGFQNAAATVGSPGFAENLRRKLWRGGLTLGLDSVERAMERTEQAARAQGSPGNLERVAQLRRRLTADRDRLGG
jgi:hypothetical protein